MNSFHIELYTHLDFANSAPVSRANRHNRLPPRMRVQIPRMPADMQRGIAEDRTMAVVEAHKENQARIAGSSAVRIAKTSRHFLIQTRRKPERCSNTARVM